MNYDCYAVSGDRVVGPDTFMACKAAFGITRPHDFTYNGVYYYARVAIGAAAAMYRAGLVPKPPTAMPPVTEHHLTLVMQNGVLLEARVEKA